MWKLILAIFAACSFLACEPECDDCEECDTDTDIGEELPPVQRAIVQAAWNGSIVSVAPDDNGMVEIKGVVGVEAAFAWEVLGMPEAEFELNAVLNIGRLKSALATCPALGLPSPTYDWFCVESNEKGRVVARDEAEPDMDSFQVYDEYPSAAYPDPMTSKLYFSSDIYPNHWGGPWQGMRGQVQSWSAAWGNARVDWCNHPVHGERCNQE